MRRLQLLLYIHNNESFELGKRILQLFLVYLIKWSLSIKKTKSNNTIFLLCLITNQVINNN